MLMGCLPLPIPHHVVPTGNVVGRVIDAETRQPIPGATLELAQQERTTSADGRFEFKPQPEWHIVYMARLLPFEGPCLDDLAVSKQNYRSECAQVETCPYFLGDGNTTNAKIMDEVGDIYLTPDRRPAGPIPWD
jgi:hypothetical protein